MMDHCLYAYGFPPALTDYEQFQKPISSKSASSKITEELTPEEHYQRAETRHTLFEPSIPFKHFKTAAQDFPTRFQLTSLPNAGSGIALDYQQVFQWLSTQKNEGDGNETRIRGLLGAQIRALLGDMHYLGLIPNREKNCTSAVSNYVEAATEGDCHSLYMTGYMLKYGEGVSQKDYKNAVKYFQRAADKGNIDALYELALMNNENNDAIPKNPEKAKALFKQASDLGHIKSTYLLGTMTTDLEEALTYYKKAAKQGDQQALRELVLIGQTCTKSRELKNLHIAFDCFNSAAELGNADAMCGLGDCYFKGIICKESKDYAMDWYIRAAQMENTSLVNGSVKVDKIKNANPINRLIEVGNHFSNEGEHAKAFKCLKSAADLGHAPAMCAVAIRYFNGRGIEKNAQQGYAYLTMAADNNWPDASYRLGLLTYGPTGLNLIKKAAGSGLGKANNYLGDHYQQKDIGTAGNYAKALHHYELAIEQQCSRAYVGLAKLYQSGGGFFSGIKSDPIKAESYFHLAVENNVMTHREAAKEILAMKDKKSFHRPVFSQPETLNFDPYEDL